MFLLEEAVKKIKVNRYWNLSVPLVALPTAGKGTTRLGVGRVAR